MENEKKRVVIYARTSTSRCQKPEVQISELRKYCRARGWAVEYELTDKGYKGKHRDRPGLQQLLKLARTRDVDVVCIVKLDRLFRSVKHIVTTVQEFNDLGVELVSMKDQFDLTIPHPKGYERQRILDAFYEKNDGKGKQSAPLRPNALLNAKPTLKEGQYNWLHISVWFGLRPKEIDNLHDEGLWKIETLRDNLKILWVYQTKIVSLPPVDRWKPIPILFAEQEEGLRMIQANSFSRPLVKTVRRYLGEDVSLYGGRKGFTDLMLENGHHLEAISQWMGHSTLDRTWRSYKNRRRFEFFLPA